MSDRSRRALVTLVLLVGLVAFEQVPLPAMDRELLVSWLGSSYNPIAARQLGIGMLGIAPWLSAYVLVELGCLAFPSGRPLRHSPEGRARMERYVRVTWLFVALAQALSTAMMLEQLTVGQTPVVFDPGWAFRLLTVATLVGGSALVRWLCHLNARHGLGPGLLLALWLMPLPELWMWWMTVRLGDVVALWPALILVAGGVLVGLRRPGRHLPLSVVGMVPLGGVVTLAGAFALYQPQVLLGLVALATVLFAVAFHRPDVVARRLGVDATWVRRDLAIGVVANGVLQLALLWGVLEAGFPGYGWGLVFTAAFAWDLVEEFGVRKDRRLVTVWQLHSWSQIPEVEDALHTVNIPCETRGQRTHVLLHTFGPFVPIEVLVAPEQADEAQQCIRLLVQGAHATPSEARRTDPVEPIPEPEPSRSPWDAPASD